jgi:hypothetical protein
MVSLDELKELYTLDKPRKVRLNELEELEDLNVQMLDELEESGEIRQEALDRLKESLRFGVYITSNTCFVLVGLRYLETVFNALPWFWPQEHRWMEELNGKAQPYILGIGRKHGEEVYVSHVFSLTEEDREGLAGILRRLEGNLEIEVSGVILKPGSSGDYYIVTVEHPGKMLNYRISEGCDEEIAEFCGVKQVGFLIT